MSTVLIVYHSFSGKTEEMAQALAGGARSVQGVEVTIKRASETQPDDLVQANAVAFGAPNTFGGMAGALRDFFDRAWPVHEKTAGKPAASFTNEMPDQTGAIQEIEKFIGLFGLQAVDKGIVAHGDIKESELAELTKLGQSLAEASTK